MNRVQTCLPLSGHRGALDVGVNCGDQPDAFVGGFQRLAVAQDIFTRNQCFNDCRASRRRAKPAILHRPREFPVIERLAGRFHRGEQTRIIEPFGWPSLLLLHDDIAYGK